MRARRLPSSLCVVAAGRKVWLVGGGRCWRRWLFQCACLLLGRCLAASLQAARVEAGLHQAPSTPRSAAVKNGRASCRRKPMPMDHRHRNRTPNIISGDDILLVLTSTMFTRYAVCNMQYYTAVLPILLATLEMLPRKAIQTLSSDVPIPNPMV